MSATGEIWIAILLCAIAGGIFCVLLIMALYKFGRQSRGSATLMGAIAFAALFGAGGYFAMMAQPEPGAAFVMMLAAFLTLFSGRVIGPLTFIAMTREAVSSRD